MARALLALWQEAWRIEGGTLTVDWVALATQQRALLQAYLEVWVQQGVTQGAGELLKPLRKAAIPGVAVTVDWALVNQRAVAWAQAYAYELVNGITELTQQRLQSAFSAWLAAGEEFPKLRERVRTIFEDAKRAELIAVTEATRAIAEGNTQAWSAAGVPERRWETANDELVCEVCGALHQQSAPVGQAFSVVAQGRSLTIANPPAHPGCRCIVKPVVKPERNHTPGAEEERNPVALPTVADGLAIVQHFQAQYGIYVDLAPGNSLRDDEARALNDLLGALPQASVRDNPRFVTLTLADQPYIVDPKTMGVHFGEQITIFPLGRALEIGSGRFSTGSALAETLYHEIGESLWKQFLPAERAEWVRLITKYPVTTITGEPPSEQFAILFSLIGLREPDIPPLLERWVKERGFVRDK